MKTVILCGGSGTRLWPLSRTLYPKQFYPLFQGQSLYQKTILRNASFSDSFILVINQEQYFMGLDQANALNQSKNFDFLLEPEGRNTAPAIALAAMSVSPEEILLIVPSDHLIEDDGRYQDCIQNAIKEATKNRLVTFGLKPTYPETGYGYIEANGNLVKSFKEKPDVQTATNYVKSGNFFWNSGMFCFKAGIFLEELKKYSPEIFQKSQETFKHSHSQSPYRFDRDKMHSIPSDSIDYSVMEKSQIVSMVPCDFKWSDLGSFNALYEALPKDENQNTQNSNAVHLNSSKNLIVSDKRLITTINVQDLVIVDTPDALLVANRHDTQKVKDLVGILKIKQEDITHTHTTVHRPWGAYSILQDEKSFKVKKIVVNPKAKLSLQKHAKRSEHWVVVEGRAKVTVGEKVFHMNRNESTYIPIGEVHRLENEEDQELILIEAQVGTYLGEDDIIRIQDDYKRN